MASRFESHERLLQSISDALATKVKTKCTFKVVFHFFARILFLSIDSIRKEKFEHKTVTFFFLKGAGGKKLLIFNYETILTKHNSRLYILLFLFYYSYSILFYFLII